MWQVSGLLQVLGLLGGVLDLPLGRPRGPHLGTGPGLVGGAERELERPDVTSQPKEMRRVTAPPLA